MTSSSSIQCLYEYSNLSSFEVTSKESFLSTVNNGKALSMTVHVRSFWIGASLRSPLSLSLSVAVLRTTHEKKSNTMTVVYSSIIHTANNGKAWSVVLYMYTYIQFGIAGSFLKALAPIFTVRTLNLLALRCGCSISARTTHNDTTDIGRATRWLWLLLWSFMLFLYLLSVS